jgi:ADP-heptose:LPS heptosyltransferase
MWRIIRLTDTLLHLFSRLCIKKSTNYDRVLIIRLDAIGDYILYRDWLTAIKAHPDYKNKTLVLLGNTRWKDLAQHYDSNTISQFLWADLTHHWSNPIRYTQLVKQIWSLDCGILLHPTFSRLYSIDLLARQSPATAKIAFTQNTSTATQNQKPTNQFYTQLIQTSNEPQHEYLRNEQFNQYLLNDQQPTAAVADKDSDSCLELRLRISPSLAFLLAPQVSNHQILKNISYTADFIVSSGHFPTNNQPTITILPGASHPTRRWSADNFANLINQIQTHYPDTKIQIAGSKQDTDLANQITAKAQGQIQNLTNQLTLPQLAEQLKNAQLVITNDTGPAHLAAALGTPLIVISNGNHYARFFPYPNHQSNNIITILPPKLQNLTHQALVKQYHQGSKEDINQITVQQILDSITNQINKI